MKWYVLYTRHHHERTVYERLLARGLELYLPLARVWRKSHRGLREMISPLFPRYLFVRCYLEMYAHLELISIPGVLHVMEDERGQLMVISEDEIRLLRKLCNTDVALEGAAYLPDGEFVEVVEGRLRGVAGVFSDQNKTTLFIPLHTLRASVAVEVGSTQVMSFPNRRKAPHWLPFPGK